MWLHPTYSEVRQGEDIPTFSGVVEFEVIRGRHRPRVTRFGDVNNGNTFSAPQQQFQPLFQDLNGDGRPDFTFCETGSHHSMCRIFSIDKSGAVVLLPVGDQGAFAVQDFEQATRSLKVVPGGFCRRPSSGENRGQCFHWNSEAGAFDIAQ